MALRANRQRSERDFGTLNDAISAFSAAMIPASVSAWPDRVTTTAVTRSPKSGSGTPMTADSTTPVHAVDPLLDFLRVDVEPAGDDEVLGAADKPQITLPRAIRHDIRPCRRS